MSEYRGSSPRPPGTVQSRLRSFRYAFAGIRHVLAEPNFRIHLAAAAVALGAGALLRIRPSEWVEIILVSMFVLVTEMLNTAIEATVDLASPEYHPAARIAKDVAAGAVLLSAIGAVIVGISIFVPRLLHLGGWF